MARSRARARGLRAHCRGCDRPKVAKKCTAELAKGSLFDTACRKSHPPAVNGPDIGSDRSVWQSPSRGRGVHTRSLHRDAEVVLQASRRRRKLNDRACFGRRSRGSNCCRHVLGSSDGSCRVSREARGRPSAAVPEPMTGPGALGVAGVGAGGPAGPAGPSPTAGPATTAPWGQFAGVGGGGPAGPIFAFASGLSSLEDRKMLSMSSSAKALRSPLKTGAGLDFAALPVGRLLRDMSSTQERG